MLKGSEIKEHVLRSGSEKLEAKGFIKKKKDEFIKPITDDIYFFSSFQFSYYGEKNFVSLIPFVGSKSKSIGRLYSQYYLNKSASQAPVLSTTLGYLTPMETYLECPFNGDIDEDHFHRLLDSIVADIEKYAYPYFEKINTLEKIYDALNNKRFRINVRSEKYQALIKVLLGKPQEGLQVLKSYLEINPNCSMTQKAITDYSNALEKIKL